MFTYGVDLKGPIYGLIPAIVVSSLWFRIKATKKQEPRGAKSFKTINRDEQERHVTCIHGSSRDTWSQGRTGFCKDLGGNRWLVCHFLINPIINSTQNESLEVKNE
jgi:hypothetical protein